MDFSKLDSNVNNLIEKVESTENHLILYIASFFFAITLRNFLEIFSNPMEVSFAPFSEFYAFYVFIFLAFLILYYFATKEKIEKIARTLSTIFLISILPPILDLILSGGANITYLLPAIHDDLLVRFFSFFGSFSGPGVTWGIKIEFLIILIGSFVYFKVKDVDLFRGLFFTFLAYVFLFVSLSAPFVVKAFLSFFSINIVYISNQLMRNFYLFLIFLESIIVFFFYRKKYFLELIRDIRPFRLTHFLLMLILGVGIAKLFPIVEYSYSLTRSNLFFWILFPISICFAWLFSVILNNIIDSEIDSVSNRDRPTITNNIPEKQYKILGIIFMILSIIYSWSISYRMAFLVTVFIGSYFLYSSPPWRLKRIPFLSNAIISLNSLILVIAGYLHVTSVPMYTFPASVILWLMLFFTGAFNAGDLKDYKGDKKAGIKTLPTILGLKKSKLAIGIFLLISYISVYFLIISDLYLLLISIVFGGLQFYVVNRKNFSEKPMFIIHTAFLILLLFFIW